MLRWTEMPDNPKLKKRDGRRVALGQEHERRYLLKRIEKACDRLYDACAELGNMASRLQAGFPERKGKAKR